MTRSTTSRDLRRPMHSDLPKASAADTTLATARRLSAAYCEIFTAICESAIRVVVPTSSMKASSSDVDSSDNDGHDDGYAEPVVEGERLVCCGGRQEHLRQRLRRVLSVAAPAGADEARKHRVCGKLVAARSKALVQAKLDRRVVDRFVDALIANFDDRHLGDHVELSAECLLQYDAPVAALRREAPRLHVARTNIARERALMIDENRRLVMRVARRFMGRGLAFDDLVQEGNLGLMRAIDKFDPERGFKFSTYAMWWIRQGIARAIVDQSRTVRLPVHLSETLARIRRTEARLTVRLERKPELSELARELDLTEERLQWLLQKVSGETSLQKPLSDSKAEFGDLLADEQAEQGLGVVEQNTLKQLLTAALDRLDSRSRYVLQAHHGLGGTRALTLGDIGKVLGLSRERVRQIENEAFQRLRKTAHEQHLDDFV